MQDNLGEEITSENTSVVSRGERLRIKGSVRSVSKSKTNGSTLTHYGFTGVVKLPTQAKAKCRRKPKYTLPTQSNTILGYFKDKLTTPKHKMQRRENLPTPNSISIFPNTTPCQANPQSGCEKHNFKDRQSQQHTFTQLPDNLPQSRD